MLRRAVLLVVLAACKPPSPGAQADAATPPPPAADAGPPTATPERSCATELRYAASGIVGTVEVAGEWDWTARTPLSDPDADGVLTATLDLPAGFYAYKLIVDGAWTLDPAQPYRKYDGGTENSGLRVGDCTAPLLAIEGATTGLDHATVNVRYWRGAGGPEPALRATVRHDFQSTDVAIAAAGGVATVELTDLGPGKYTVVVDADGAEPVLAPLWIEPEPFDWREIIYMVMLDRFRNGDTSNDPAPAPGAEPSADYAGGDLAGLAEVIETGWFNELGVRVLWVSPWSANTPRVHSEDSHGVTGYHGYWPIDGRALDPRFGTPEDLERVVEAAHGRGIRVIMDLVINHVHEDHAYAQQHPEWFRTGCVCGTAGCGWTERRLDCLFHDYMPDIDWTNAAAGDAFIADALWWLERYDLDGFRVDAVKHVEDAAVRNLSAAIDDRFERAGTEYFLLGETAMGWAGHSIADNRNEYDTISRYLGEYGLTGQFDFVLYHAVAYRVFANDEYGLLHADFWARASLDNYPADAIMTPYIGSHDTQRFVTLATYRGTDGIAFNKWPEQGLPPAPTTDEPYARAAVALTWVLTQPGAPLLYYGDEYGEYGASDPDNRHMWRAPDQRTARESALYDVVARVGRARRQSRALRSGGYETIDATESFLCFARVLPDDLALVALNHSDAPVTRTLTLPRPIPQLHDTLDPARPALDASSGTITLELAPRSAAILLP